MTTDERDIIAYLKMWPNVFISGREIARKVGGRERFEENTRWAVPVLRRMVEAGFLESDPIGHYRLKPEDPRKKRNKKHLSPQMLKILRNSGKNFDGVALDDGNDG